MHADQHSRHHDEQPEMLSFEVGRCPGRARSLWGRVESLWIAITSSVRTVARSNSLP